MVRAINQTHDSNDGNPLQSISYTPARATKTLPLVRRIVRDLARLSASVATQKEQLRAIDALPETFNGQAYLDEVSDMRDSLAQDVNQLKSYQDELASFGVEAHEPFDGSVDFPAQLNRRPVFLCWLPDDDRVEYWHELGQTSRDRKKWDATTVGC
ncbi:hypothetical protein Poly51_60960 [Rubripirellula tenax]|uniref:DUF2203 domain-containing protein n=1 Tax=Rubripirellula tenax TaxID=2528015 RepID=A0A5C6E6V4_9BACT|nr:DUF2203 domain-containing protein [Rubripirellula tenax]TWU44530.1 hypothetical protein Poly51_60960 [Rubripirellula tenax]